LQDGVRASIGAHGDLAGRKGRGRGEGAQLWGQQVDSALLLLYLWRCSHVLFGPCAVLLACYTREEEKEEGERRRKVMEGKEKKRKKIKIYGKFSKLENFQGKNRRQLMKLVKNIFLKKKEICLIINR
jgi:hypothetical protein